MATTTMTARFGPGQTLTDLIDQTQALIRKEPGASKHRISLFQLMAVNGAWDRAITQLGVLADLDPEAASMVQTYQEVIRCERFREEVFAGNRTPLFVGEPEDWIAKLVEALRATANGKAEVAAALRAEAFDAAPTIQGSLNDAPFEWIADADVRLGPVLEAVVNGKYYWIPFHRLSKVDIEPPEDLRDLVWCPAVLTFASGGEQVAFIPTRYLGSEKSADEAIRLSRRTEWQDLGADTYVGLGQRMLATDADEYPLLDVRKIVLAATT